MTHLVIGLVLLGISACAIFFLRPRNGVSPPFMESELAATGVSLVVTAGIITGVALCAMAAIGTRQLAL